MAQSLTLRGPRSSAFDFLAIAAAAFPGGGVRPLSPSFFSGGDFAAGAIDRVVVMLALSCSILVSPSPSSFSLGGSSYGGFASFCGGGGGGAFGLTTLTAGDAAASLAALYSAVKEARMLQRCTMLLKPISTS